MRRAIPVLLLTLLCTGAALRAAERPDGPLAEAQCVSCHAGIQSALVRGWQASGHGAAQVGCSDCHGATHDGGARARRSAACSDCHGGDKAAAVHSYATSKHGVIVTLQGADWDWTQPLRGGNYRAPSCAYCHLHSGEHDTRRLLAEVEDEVASRHARDAASAVCYDCHAPRYVARQGETGARMLEIAQMKQREGAALIQGARDQYQDAELVSALRLFEGMQAHVSNVRLGVAHQSPDYQWWHGQPALDGDLLRLKGALSRMKRTSNGSPASNAAP